LTKGPKTTTPPPEKKGAGWKSPLPQKKGGRRYMIAFRFLHRALRGVGERKKIVTCQGKSLFIYLSGIMRDQQ
jgi:hypothetical protein